MGRRVVRWAAQDDPEDRPRPGEIVGRLELVDVKHEHYPGAGRPAPRARLAADGTLVAATEPEPTDLHVARVRVLMIVEADDGRRLAVRFPPGVDAPQIDVDADADLRDAVIRLWRDRAKPGRPSERDARITAIVRAAAALPEGADTRDRVAVELGRVRRVDGEPTGEPSSAFKEDVSKAGGWPEIQRLAAILREPG